MTRRELGKIAAAALTCGKLLATPNAKVGGVQIGVILSPTALKDIPVPADEMLKTVVDLGINAVELQEVRVEAWAGAPPATRGAAAELAKWRVSAPMDKYKRLRQMYHDAGVHIYAFRAARIADDTPDEIVAYYFNGAQALGANQVTMELPKNPELTQRLGAYAAKHKIMLGYHNHTQVNFNSWDTALEQSKYNGINFDVGHFAAAVSQSPIPFLEKHHDRITCLHLKDRKFGTNGGQNVPWGDGDTSLKEVLQVVKRKKYPFPAGIELEYKIPEGSTTRAELAKCLQFCRDALA
jgi:sugar phosphate isomerase/epimerase